LVVHFQRRPFPGHYSIERAFEHVRPALQARFEIEVVVAPEPSLGLLPRFRTVLEARRRQGELTHVTGDINFAAILMRRRETILTIHDLEFLDRASLPKRLIYTWLWLRLPLSKAAAVTVPSEATRLELLQVVNLDPARVHVVPVPVGNEFLRLPQLPPSQQLYPGQLPTAPGRQTVLIVGTRSNKNVERAAMALRGLPVKVTVVGELSAPQQEAFEAAGVEHEVRSMLDDDELLGCYEACHLLLFASTKEGFGMPILEAQAAGRPVVTSDMAPMRDVAGGGACLVDPFDVESIHRGVQRVLDDDGYRAALVRWGFENVESYRPEVVAEQYASIYLEVWESAYPEEARLR